MMLSWRRGVDEPRGARLGRQGLEHDAKRPPWGLGDLRALAMRRGRDRRSHREGRRPRCGRGGRDGCDGCDGRRSGPGSAVAVRGHRYVDARDVDARARPGGAHPSGTGCLGERGRGRGLLDHVDGATAGQEGQNREREKAHAQSTLRFQEASSAPATRAKMNTLIGGGRTCETSVCCARHLVPVSPGR
jgi:hypothetical protein